MFNHMHYTYRVTWSAEDQEFVGLVAEFPSLSFLDENQVAALQGIVDLVGQIVPDMVENGETLPEPISEKQYSGKFQVRTTPDLHRKLALEAQETNLSLNRLVNAKLSS